MTGRPLDLSWVDSFEPHEVIVGHRETVSGIPCNIDEEMLRFFSESNFYSVFEEDCLHPNQV